MFKKISVLGILLVLLFSLASCKSLQYQKEIEEIAYNCADISEFFGKSEDLHLRVNYEYEVRYEDDDDTIYNMLVRLDYHEEISISSVGVRSAINLDYLGHNCCMYFYPEHSIISRHYIANFKFDRAEAERFYKVDETDFKNLYEKLEYCVANPNVEEKN